MLPSELLSDWRNTSFMRVSPVMVRLCDHDFTTAAVVAHLLYRTYDGTQPWVGTVATLCEETGATPKQMRRVLAEIRKLGWVKITRAGQWDNTNRYEFLTTDEPDRQSPPTPHRSGPNEPDRPTPDGRLLPLIEDVKEEKQELPIEDVLLGEILEPKPKSKALVRGEGAALFDEFWSHSVKKVDKGSARRAWLAATKHVDPHVVIAAWVEHNQRWRTWDASEYKYIKHPSTWLNSCCWEDEVLPEMFKGRSGHAVAEEVMTQVTQNMTIEEEKRFLFPEMYATPNSNGYKADVPAINDVVDRNEEE